MRTLLREAYSEDPEKSILRQFSRALRDPAMPHDPNERPRVHAIWLTLSLVVVLVVLVFVYFSLRS